MHVPGGARRLYGRAKAGRVTRNQLCHVQMVDACALTGTPGKFRAVCQNSLRL